MPHISSLSLLVVLLAIFKDLYNGILTSNFLKGPLKVPSESEQGPLGWVAKRAPGSLV